MLKKLLIFIIFITPVHWVLAQNNNSQLFGVVQFVSGEVTWQTRPGRDLKSTIDFKTLIHANDIISIKTKLSYIKIVSTQGCTAVVYGPAAITAPINSLNKTWITQGGSTRWICKDGYGQKTIVDQHPIDLFGGEYLYSEQKLLILKGQVTTPIGGEFKVKQTYTLDKNNWQVLTESDQKVYSFNQNWPAPIESNKLPKPKSEETSRWILAITEGKADFKPADEIFHNDNLEFTGGRLSFHYKLGTKSLFGSLRFTEHFSNNDGRRECDSSGCSNSGGPNDSNSLKGTLAEIGWRLNHNRNWSWYYLVGLGQYEFQLHSFFRDGGCTAQPCANEFRYSREETFFVGSLATGVDYLLRFDWFGVYFAGELLLLKSISHQETKFDNSCGSSSCENEMPGVDPAKGIAMFGLSLNIGLMLLF